MTYVWVILSLFVDLFEGGVFGIVQAPDSVAMDIDLTALRSQSDEALKKKWLPFRHARICQEKAKDYLNRANEIQNTKREDETIESYQARINKKIKLYKRAFIAANSSNLTSPLAKHKRKAEFEKLDQNLRYEFENDLICINCTYKNRCKDFKLFDQAKESLQNIVQKTNDHILNNVEKPLTPLIIKMIDEKDFSFFHPSYSGQRKFKDFVDQSMCCFEPPSSISSVCSIFQNMDTKSIGNKEIVKKTIEDVVRNVLRTEIGEYATENWPSETKKCSELLKESIK